LKFHTSPSILKEILQKKRLVKLITYKSKNGNDTKEFDAVDFIAFIASHIPNKNEQWSGVCVYEKISITKILILKPCLKHSRYNQISYKLYYRKYFCLILSKIPDSLFKIHSLWQIHYWFRQIPWQISYLCLGYTWGIQKRILMSI
jgi:hypothetical protein